MGCRPVGRSPLEWPVPSSSSLSSSSSTFAVSERGATSTISRPRKILCVSFLTLFFSFSKPVERETQKKEEIARKHRVRKKGREKDQSSVDYVHIGPSLPYSMASTDDNISLSLPVSLSLTRYLSLVPAIAAKRNRYQRQKSLMLLEMESPGNGNPTTMNPL